MKRIILSLLLCATFNMFGAKQMDSETPQKVIVDIYKQYTQYSPQERTISSYELDVYTYNVSNIVEVRLYNIGLANISILDNCGLIVDSLDVDTDLPTILNFDMSEDGNYYIVISSTGIYAEGYFNI